MKDDLTLDFAFVFKNPEVAVWAHQELLTTTTPELADWFDLPTWIDETDTPRLHAISCVDVPDRLFNAHCAFIRYLYTGKLERKVDLRQFCMSPREDRPPEKQRMVYNNDINRLLARPLRTAWWSDLHDLAMVYGVPELRMLCEEHL